MNQPRKTQAIETGRVKIIDAKLLTSVPKVSQLPAFSDPAPPQFILAGRSNVGKSSFINTMLQRKKLAYTSNTPGKTRLFHYYEAAVAIQANRFPVVFIDLPGYGYARTSKTEREAWRREITVFFQQDDPHRRVLHLIDSRHGATDLDKTFNDWLPASAASRLVIATKTDKLSNNRVPAALADIATALSVSQEAVMAFSAQTGHGREAVWKRLLETDA